MVENHLADIHLALTHLVDRHLANISPAFLAFGQRQYGQLLNFCTVDMSIKYQSAKCFSTNTHGTIYIKFSLNFFLKISIWISRKDYATKK
jgi:hypothetical protein